MNESKNIIYRELGLFEVQVSSGTPVLCKRCKGGFCLPVDSKRIYFSSSTGSQSITEISIDQCSLRKRHIRMGPEIKILGIVVGNKKF